MVLNTTQHEPSRSVDAVGVPAREPDLTVAGLIHDLNNVFQTLVDAADLLSTDPKHVDTSDMIFRCVERGRDIMSSLNESTRSCEFEAVVTRAFQFTRDFAAAAQLEPPIFRSEIDPGLRFSGKPFSMERVLVNLFVNSVRVMRRNSEITVRARESAGELEVCVSDNGPGIPQDVLPRIFEPGFSATKSSGLGLHIVRTIILEHRGKVEAANGPDGRGARFLIRVPVSGYIPGATA